MFWRADFQEFSDTSYKPFGDGSTYSIDSQDVIIYKYIASVIYILQNILHDAFWHKSERTGPKPEKKTKKWNPRKTLEGEIKWKQKTMTK